MLLDATNKSLKVILAEAKGTLDCDFVATYADITDTPSFTPAAQDGVTNGITAVTLVSSPGSDIQRQIKYLSIYNSDNIPHSATVQYISGANTRKVFTAFLTPGSSMTWDPKDGWTVNQSTTSSIVTNPQGRVTLTSGTPVLAVDTTGATTIYYTPYNGNQVPLWNGTGFALTSFAELNQALSDTTKSPAASSANHNYDMFVWNDAGTPRCTRGPAWSSDTSRGTGGGTSELARQNGLLVNVNAITNGPAAGYGTYVGTIRTNGSNSVDMIQQPNAAAGGPATNLYCWNMYNRISIGAFNIDSTSSWTYTTAAWRQKNASTGNQINFVVGQPEETFDCFNSQLSTIAVNGNIRYNGIGYDSTSATATGSSSGALASGTIAPGQTALATFTRPCEIGYHYVAALEFGNATSTPTFYGDNNSCQSCLFFIMEM